MLAIWAASRPLYTVGGPRRPAPAVITSVLGYSAAIAIASVSRNNPLVFLGVVGFALPAIGLDWPASWKPKPHLLATIVMIALATHCLYALHSWNQLLGWPLALPLLVALGALDIGYELGVNWRRRWFVYLVPYCLTTLLTPAAGPVGIAPVGPVGMALGLFSGLMGAVGASIGDAAAHRAKPPKDGEPAKLLETGERPLPALGYRGFRVETLDYIKDGVRQPFHVLCPLNEGLPGRWVGPEMKAECYRCGDGCPGDSCHCGLYCLYRPDQISGWSFHLNRCGHCVVVAVGGFGEVIEHSSPKEGFRASDLKVLAVLERDGNRAISDPSADVATQLGVPMLKRSALEAYVKEFADPLPSSPAVSRQS